MFMIKYAYSSFANTYFSFYLWQDYENAFRNAAGSSLEYIRERLCMFIVSKVINSNGEFYYNIED